MRMLILLLFMLCCMLSSAQAQDIRAMFMNAPDSVLPLLPRNVRADCIDFADAGMSYPVSNKLDGKSTLKKLTDDYLLLQSTGISTVEMKMLPFRDSFVICVVNTVYAEAADSRIAFFNNDWQRIDDESLFKAPLIRDFFDVADEKAVDMCDIYLVSLNLCPDDESLVAEYTMPNYMNEDDARKVCPFLKKIVYRWNGEGFVME